MTGPSPQFIARGRAVEQIRDRPMVWRPFMPTEKKEGDVVISTIGGLRG